MLFLGFDFAVLVVLTVIMGELDKKKNDTVSASSPDAILASIPFTLRSEVSTVNHMVTLLILNPKPK